jgi:hypothetical protein
MKTTLQLRTALILAPLAALNAAEQPSKAASTGDVRDERCLS